MIKRRRAPSQFPMLLFTGYNIKTQQLRCLLLSFKFLKRIYLYILDIILRDHFAEDV